MSEHGDSLMVRPAVARLREAESGVFARALAGRAGTYGLHLGVDGLASTQGVRLACAACLRLQGSRWRGDVQARVDEPLPFVDEAFCLVVIDHVLEWTPQADGVLAECTRVLASDGTLVVTGFHPFSPWLPWLLCRRRPRPMLTPPGWLRQRLAMHGVDTLRVERCGGALPLSRMPMHAPGMGGGFVLVARKQHAVIMPMEPAFRLRGKRAGQPVAWAPGTHRECA